MADNKLDAKKADAKKSEAKKVDAKKSAKKSKKPNVFKRLIKYLARVISSVDRPKETLIDKLLFRQFKPTKYAVLLYPPIRLTCFWIS